MIAADEPIGYIGLGQMGGAIADRLMLAGCRLVVHDPNADACARFQAAGVEVVRSPKDVADRAAVVFACLPNAAASAEVALGENGIAAGTRCRTYIENSTIGIAAMRRIDAGLAARGIELIDAPVSGGPRGAQNGTLALMVGAGADGFARTEQLFRTIGRNVFHVGNHAGLGQAMKLTNNMISSTNMVIAFECLVLGAKAGLAPDVMVDVINASTGRNSATQDKVPAAVLTGSFDYGAKLEIMYKDVRLALEEAELLNVPMWLSQTAREIWRFALTQGAGQEDFTSLIRFMEDWAGVQVRSSGVGADG